MSDFVKRGSQIEAPKGPRCSRCQKIIGQDGYGGFCSSDCKLASSEDLSQERLRALVLERDKGICAEPGCGMDTLALREELDLLAADAERDRAAGLLVMFRGRRLRLEARVHMLVRLGFPRGPVENGGTLWECAHVKAKVQGGANDPRNCVTLCLAHHRDDTNALAASRASSRKLKGRGFSR